MKILSEIRKLFFDLFTFSEFFQWFVLLIVWVYVLKFSFGLYVAIWIVLNLLDALIHPSAKDIRKKYDMKGPYDDEEDDVNEI